MCRCNKEVEIAEMHKDIKFIVKLLDGNGNKGLVNKVDSNTTWRYLTNGGLIVLAVMIGWMATIVSGLN